MILPEKCFILINELVITQMAFQLRFPVVNGALPPHRGVNYLSKTTKPYNFEVLILIEKKVRTCKYLKPFNYVRIFTLSLNNIEFGGISK